MRDVLPTIEQWIGQGERFAVAVVTQTWGSSPRPVGSILAVCESGQSVGSVSGGCVEAAVTEAALKTIATGTPKALSFEAIGQDEVWKIGLSCGGRIDVWVIPGDRLPWHQIRLGPVEVVIEHPDGGAAFTWKVKAQARLVIVGGVHIAQPLIALAKVLDFETIVIEPREGLRAPERFLASPDRILSEWPDLALENLDLDADTYVVTLTHDPKLDDPALATSLRMGAGYIGALGSRTTHAQRCERLKAEGLSEKEIGRIRGPVGLPIGARTPAEIALSIMAEVVQVRNGA